MTDEAIRNFNVRLSALEILVCSVLASLTNRDVELGREIVDQLTRPAPADVTPLDVHSHAVKTALDDLVENFREQFAAE